MDGKLKKLMEIEGYDDVVKLIQDGLADSVCPGICMNADCDFTAEFERDQERGYCEICGTNTVKSALILVGII